MRHQQALIVRSVLVAILLLFSASARAGTFTIAFNEKEGYAPSYLLLYQGDVVVLRGDFAKFPLHFDSVPPGMHLPPDVTSGTSFTLMIKSGGLYHFSSPGSKFKGMIAAQPERISVERHAEQAAFTVYPNPVSTKLHIRLAGGDETPSYSLINALGHSISLDALIADREADQLTLDISSLQLSAGSYVLQAVTKKSVFTRKLTVTGK